MASNPDRDSSYDDDRTTVRSWHEWEVRDGERRIILCVSTSLELRPGFAGFDTVQLEALTREATDMMRASASPIDAIRIVPEKA